MPQEIDRDKYQYFTEADTKKLRSAGFMGGFTGLEEREFVIILAILMADYICNRLRHK